MNRVSEINESYIAGFFDGEGSACIITIRRKKDSGWTYQFRPTIKIAQRTSPVLYAIKEYFGYGEVINRNSGVYSYVIKNMNDCVRFINKIYPFAFIKKRVLLALLNFCNTMDKKGYNKPYTKEQILTLISLRDEIFNLNCITRSKMLQKYPKEKILTEHSFMELPLFLKIRATNGALALNDYAKSIKNDRLLKEKCLCGCNKDFFVFDNKGRRRKYINGHNRKINLCKSQR